MSGRARRLRRGISSRQILAAAIEPLENRLVLSAALTYGGPGTALSLSEVTAATDNVAISEPSAGTLKIDLNGATFDATSTAAATGLTYQTGNPATSTFATVDISAANNITTLSVNLGSNDDQLSVSMTNAVGGVHDLNLSPGTGLNDSITLGATTVPGAITAVATAVNVSGAISGGGNITLTAGANNSINPANVLTINGNVSFTGTNGTIGLGGNTLIVNAATVSAAGNGVITADFGGFVGFATFNNGASLTTANGDMAFLCSTSITMNGTASISAGGAGNLTFTTNKFALATTASLSANDGITNGNNNITINPSTPAVPVDLGSNIPNTLGFTDAQLDRIDAESLTLVSGAGGNITISNSIDLTAGAHSVGTLNLISGSGIVDGTATEQTDLKVANLSMAAQVGIGASDDIDIAVTNLAYQNVIGGDVRISNSGALTITGVGAITGLPGNVVGNIGVAGITSLAAASPITFAVNTTSVGTLTATAAETTVPTASFDNITVNTGVIVKSNFGDVQFLAGDDISIAASAAVQAPLGNIDLRSGFGDNDNEGIMALDGLISVSSGVGTIALNVASTNSALPAGTAIATQAAGGKFFGNALLLLNAPAGTTGGFDLDSPFNIVSLIAAATNSAVHYRNATDLEVSSVGSTLEGATAAGIQTNSHDARLCVTGDLLVFQVINAGTARILLDSTGNVSQNINGDLTANTLGVRADGNIFLPLMSNAVPFVGLQAGGTITYNSAIPYTAVVLPAEDCFRGATPPGFTVSDVTRQEGNSGVTAFTFLVTLTAAQTSTVQIGYATADGTATTASGDYEPAMGTLTFLPGQTQETVTVFVNGDKTIEADETFTLNLGPVSTTTLAIVDGQGVGTIVNDDPTPASSPGISVNDVSTTEGNSGTKNMTFTVKLSRSSTSTTTVKYSTADGTATKYSDYTPISGTLTFLPGQTSKTVSVAIKGDKTVEKNETVLLALSAPTHAFISDAIGIGTIINDDSTSPPAKPGIRVNDVSVLEGNSGTKLLTFTVTLSQATTNIVTVKFTTADGTAKTSNNDYVATSGTITFAAGQLSKTVSVTVKGDTTHEADENFLLALSAPTNATIIDNIGIGTIRNDDA